MPVRRAPSSRHRLTGLVSCRRGNEGGSMYLYSRQRRSPDAAASVPSRRAAVQALSGPEAVLALQRAVGNEAVAALLGRPPIQRALDVFNKAHYENPEAYLSNLQGGPHSVSEEPGSFGITGAPDRSFIEWIATAKGRKGFRDVLAARRKEEEAEQKRLEALAGAPGATFQDQITHTNNAKKAEELAATCKELVSGLANVTNRASAALYFLQNHMKFGPDGLNLSEVKLVRMVGTAGLGHRDYVFHKDSGFLKVQESALQGPPQQQKAKADALNGPFDQRGWVQGHDGIDNWKHRFIEHIHVNKNTPTAIDIYNGTAKDGENAVKHAEKKGTLMKPTGRDEQAVTNVKQNKRALDLGRYA